MKKWTALFLTLAMLLSFASFPTWAEDTAEIQNIPVVDVTAKTASNINFGNMNGFDENSDPKTMFDGKTNTSYLTGWYGASNRLIFIFELEQAADLSSFTFQFGPHNWAANVSPSDYTVSVSDDGLLFTPVYSVSGKTDDLPVNTARVDEQTLETPVKNVKYVCLTVTKHNCTGTSDGNYLVVNEVSFGGVPSSGSTDQVIRPINAASNRATDSNNYSTSTVIYTNALENLYDGDLDSAWWTASGNIGTENGETTDQILTFTLPNVTRLTDVRFTLTGTVESWGATAEENKPCSLTGFDLLVSADGVNYTKAYSHSGDTYYGNCYKASDTYKRKFAQGVLVNKFSAEADTDHVKYIRLVNRNGKRTAVSEFWVTGTDSTDGITVKGAQVRPAQGALKEGLRFAAQVNKAAFGISGEYSYVNNSGVTFGMYLLPKAKLGTAATLKEYLANNAENEALLVEGKNVFSQNDESLVYTAVLTDIPRVQYQREIVALPYVTANGTTVYGEEMTKSYYLVAKAMLESGAKLTDLEKSALQELIAIAENPNPVDYVAVSGSDYVSWGRSNAKNNLIWSGATFEYSCTGTYAGLTINTDNNAQGAIDVSIDGGAFVRYELTDGTKDYVFADDLDEGTHTVRVVRLSQEWVLKSAKVEKIIVSEGAKVISGYTHPTDLKIEFLGDSITAAVGIDHYTDCYSYLTAEALNAEYRVCAMPGCGVYRWGGWDPTKTDASTRNMLTMYNDVFVNDGKYDHSSFSPDVVVMNIGTNDSVNIGEYGYFGVNYTGDKDYKTEQINLYVENFTSEYAKLLEKIHTEHPDAVIVACCGQMGLNSRLETAIKEQIATFLTKYPTAKCEFLKFPYSSDMSAATKWHPGVSAHKANAEALTAKIREMLGQ